MTQRIQNTLVMPTSTLQVEEDDKTEKSLGCRDLCRGNSLREVASNFVDTISRYCQSKVEVEVDQRNAGGYQSIINKSLHSRMTIGRDALLKLLLLRSDDIELSMAVSNLMDFRAILNSMTEETI